MATDRTDAEKRAHVRKLINGIRTAMMVTLSEQGTMHGRPMATADVDEAVDTLWFGTQRDSHKVDELRHDNRVALAYVNTSGSDWVSVTGRARVVDDRGKARELWGPHWKNWFESPDDPNLVLIAVTPEIAEYWDSGSKLVQVAALAAAAVTGKHFNEGENASVQFGGSRT